MKSLLIAILIFGLSMPMHALAESGRRATATPIKDTDPPLVDDASPDPHAGNPGGFGQFPRPIDNGPGIPQNILIATRGHQGIARALWGHVQQLNQAHDPGRVDTLFNELFNGLNQNQLLHQFSNEGRLDATSLFQGLCLNAPGNPLLVDKFMSLADAKRGPGEDAKEPNPLAKEPPKEWKEYKDPKGKTIIEKVDLGKPGSPYRDEVKKVDPKLLKMPATKTATGKTPMPATGTGKGVVKSDRGSPARASMFASMGDFLKSKYEGFSSPVRPSAAGGAGAKGVGDSEGTDVDGDDNQVFPPELPEGCFNNGFDNNNDNNNINNDQNNNADNQDDQNPDDKNPGEPNEGDKKKGPQPPGGGGAGAGKGKGDGDGKPPEFPSLGALAPLAVAPWVSEVCFVCPAIMAITNSMSASQFDRAAWAASLQASQDAFAANMSALVTGFGESLAPYGTGAFRGVVSNANVQTPLLGNSQRNNSTNRNGPQRL